MTSDWRHHRKHLTANYGGGKKRSGQDHVTYNSIALPEKKGNSLHKQKPHPAPGRRRVRIPTVTPVAYS